MFFAAVLLMRARELFLLMIPLSRRPTSPLPTSSFPPSSRLGIFNATLQGDIFSISLHNELFYQMIPCQAGYFLIDLNVFYDDVRKIKKHCINNAFSDVNRPTQPGKGGG